MSTRTTSELRQAAVDAGWAGDPLADELLNKLSELESALAKGGGVLPTSTPTSVWLALGVAIILAVGSGWAYLNASSTAATERAERVRVEGSLATLQAEHNRSIESATTAAKDKDKSFQATVAELSSRSTSLASELATAKSENAALKMRIATLEGQLQAKVSK